MSVDNLATNCDTQKDNSQIDNKQLMAASNDRHASIHLHSKATAQRSNDEEEERDEERCSSAKLEYSSESFSSKNYKSSSSHLKQDQFQVGVYIKRIIIFDSITFWKTIITITINNKREI